MLNFTQKNTARCIFFALAGILLLLAGSVSAQVSLTGSTYSQNFDGIGSSAFDKLGRRG